MPTPIIPKSGQPQQNVANLGPGAGPIQNIDATPFAKDIGALAAQTFVPNLTTLTGLPTIVDANSLGILIAGAGVGQIKRFVAEAAIKRTSDFYNTQQSIKLVDDIAEDLTFEQYGAPVVDDNKQFPNDQTYMSNGTNGSYLFDTLIFNAFDLKEYTINQTTAEVNEAVLTPIPDIQFTNAIISVALNKTVIESVPVGSQIGTIKEITSVGEYKISVQGHIVNPTNPKEYYNDMIVYMNLLANASQAISVRSTFLNTFGIHNIVLTDFNLQQVQGFSGILTYNMTMISETPINLDTNVQKSVKQLKNKNIK